MKNKYTLGNNYVLRRNSKDSFMLFNTFTSMEYTITKELYFILKLFKYNLVSKQEVYTYFNKNNIAIDVEKFENTIAQSKFHDLLIESSIPNSTDADIVVDEFPPFVDYTPMRVELLLTERCNLQCKHCFQNSNPFKLIDFPELERLIPLCDELETLNIKNLKITGGEPLLYPKIIELLDYLKDKKYQKSILSNALLLTDSIINLIKGYNFRFGISLDGATPETHEFLRGKSTFRKTIENIKKLKNNNIYFSITTTVHSHNYENVNDICRLVFNDLGADNLNVNVMLPLGRGVSNDDICLNKLQMKILKENMTELKDKYINKTIQLPEGIEEVMSNGQKSNLIYCSGGTNMIAINQRLEVYPCTYAFGMNEFMMGVAGDEKLIDIWKKEKWDIFRGKTKLEELKSCYSCKFNKKCSYLNCRIKPIYQGLDFYSPVTYCKQGSVFS